MSIKCSASFSFGGQKKVFDFGQPERMKTSKMIPGPGNYSNIDLKHVASKTTTYSFAKEPRMVSAKTILPGPGTYSEDKAEVHKNKMPKFSLGKSQRSIDLFVTVGGSTFFGTSKYQVRAASPGPGHYQLDASIAKTKPRVRSVAAEKSKRYIDFRNENLKTPGPAAYDNNTLKVKDKKPTYSLSKQIRNDPFMISKQKEKLPGPGVYNLNTTIGSGQKSMLRGKPKYNADNGVPGPGAYTEKKSEVSKSGGWKMIKARDDSFLISKESVHLLGPGVYTSSPTSFNTKIHSYGKFHAKIPLKEHIATASNPGVGEYSIKSGFGQAPSLPKTITTKH